MQSGARSLTRLMGQKLTQVMKIISDTRTSSTSSNITAGGATGYGCEDGLTRLLRLGNVEDRTQLKTIGDLSSPDQEGGKGPRTN